MTRLPSIARGKQYERALLLESARSEPDAARIAALLDVADVHAVIELARHHRIEGLLHHRWTTLDIGLAPPIRTRLKNLRMAAAARELLAQETLARLSRAIEPPFLVVKGPVLAEHWHAQLGVRSYSDVDVLVRQRDFAEVLDALVADGFEELATNWGGFLEYQVAEVPLGERTTVDLHWHLISMGKHRRHIHLDEDELFATSRRATVGTVAVETLDPELTLLHLCINSGLGGARRLLSLVDVDVVVRTGEIDWRTFVERARDARACALCSAVLQRAAALLHTPVPASLLRTLQPFPGWLAANALTDRPRRGVDRLLNGVASGLLLSSGRSTPTLTLAVAMREIPNAIRHRAGGPKPTAPGGALHWRRSAGGARDRIDRERYLDWVALGNGGGGRPDPA